MPFGILVKSPKPELLLLGGEGAMIGRDHLQRAGAQAVPQIVLIDLVAERRRHDAPRGVLPVLVEIFALVEHEMLNKRLAIDALSQRARPGDRFVRLDAGRMDDIDRHARLVGEHDRAIGRLALDVGRARQGVAFRPGDALCPCNAAAGRRQVAVLGMNERHRAELGAADEGGEHLLVVDHQRALVGHEMLESRHARLRRPWPCPRARGRPSR